MARFNEFEGFWDKFPIVRFPALTISIALKQNLNLPFEFKSTERVTKANYTIPIAKGRATLSLKEQTIFKSEQIADKDVVR